MEGTVGQVDSRSSIRGWGLRRYVWLILVTIVVPHVRNALFLMESVRTLTHFIIYIYYQKSYSKYLKKIQKNALYVFLGFSLFHSRSSVSSWDFLHCTTTGYWQITVSKFRSKLIYPWTSLISLITIKLKIWNVIRFLLCFHDDYEPHCISQL